ncbi:sulfatase family protein [Carboxylicivirga marina]|uniref:sulfatase family protein n=1 Tax=Carboxylicivirga marina TaxID=2800988 RepID=UPI00259431B5|nr:sulfatase [uncultured Carboxylicivirga sp.]
MKKTIIFFIVALLVIGCSRRVQKAEKPNILFIMSDDHTSQAWGIYGGVLKDYVHAPNINRLADEGVVLDNCFCTNSICVPSRATILTGQYSHRNGVYMLRDKARQDSLNIAKVLNEAGYQTAIVGKWHLKTQPQGFDYFNVLPDQGVYHNPVLKSKENWQDGYKGGKVYEGFSTDVITDLTIDWLDKRDESKPFMMMCHFKATHEPFDFPDRFKNLYDDVEIPEPASLYDFDPRVSGRTFIGQSLEKLAWRWETASKDPDKWWCKYPELPFSTENLDSVAARKKTYQKLVKDFMRCGATIDDNIGRLLDYLKAQGLDENTVVIYTSDQGYFLGEHGFFDKRMILEESLRMPFVIKYPQEIEGGKRIQDIILNIDFAALFADYAGVKSVESFQGKSFRDNLKGNTKDGWRKSMYYRYWEHSPDRPAHIGIRNEQHKLIFFYGRAMDEDSDVQSTLPAWEFYDLVNDPNELHNAYADESYADVIREMKEELKKQRRELGDDDRERTWIKDIIDQHLN